MSTGNGTHRGFSFGAFTLDLDRGALLKGGADIKLRPKSFEVLRLLLERHGRLVSKDELLHAVWGSTVVTEGALTQCLIDVRRAIGDESQQMIRTVPRRGYIFDVPVTEPPHSSSASAHAAVAQLPGPTHALDVTPRAVEDPVPVASEPAPRRPETGPRYRRLLTLTALGLVGIAGLIFLVLRALDSPRVSAPAPAPSIAVLPFVDMSPEGNQQYFADGLAEEILNQLSQSAGLRVIARTSSFSFRDRSTDIATIAGKLNVTHVLEGSVRKSGERIRITAQLVDAATSVHTWSETYDRDVQDVFAVQKDIAASVAASLHVNLVRNDRDSAGETNSPQVYEYYLQGRYFFHRRGGSADLARARSYFEKALKIDPTYARAWAGLAGAYWVGPDVNEPMTAETLPKWREAIEHALRFGPNLAEAHVRAAQYHWTQGDMRRGDEHFERAKVLNPSDLLVLGVSAGQAIHDGRLNEGIAIQRRAVALDPLSAVYRGSLAAQLMAAGQWEQAKAELQKALELSPTSLQYHADLCKIHVLQQRFDQALTAIGQVPEGYPQDSCLALVYHAKGNAAASDAALARLITHAATSQDDMGVKLSIAETYAYRGDHDAAFEVLAQAYRQAHDSGDAMATWWMQLLLRLSPFLRPLSADPRWQPLFVGAPPDRPRGTPDR